MARHAAAWYDAQYNARAAIPEATSILQQWFDDSAAARAGRPCELDLPYGDEASERLDLFLPARRADGRAAPVLVYIHGGYWRALDKRDQSFVAAPFAAAGALAVMTNYALCPAVSVEHIVLQLVRALSWVWRHAARYGGDPDRIVVAGHSAGGHLAAMMLACRWREVGADLPPDLVKAALALSGLFELEPLRHAPFLAPDLNLDAATARRLSPAAMPAPCGRLVALVGGVESAEFKRQNRLIARRWGAQAVPVCETLPGRHHMSVLRELATPGSRAHGLALDLLGLGRSAAPRRPDSAACPLAGTSCERLPASAPR
jgi:arylformamidase